MTRRRKLLRKFLERPESLSFADIEKILLNLGFEKIGVKGSHVKFRHEGRNLFLMFPLHGGDCGRIYKKIAANLIKKSNLNDYE